MTGQKRNPIFNNVAERVPFGFCRDNGSYDLPKHNTFIIAKQDQIGDETEYRRIQMNLFCLEQGLD